MPIFNGFNYPWNSISHVQDYLPNKIHFLAFRWYILSSIQCMVIKKKVYSNFRILHLCKKYKKEKNLLKKKRLYTS